MGQLRDRMEQDLKLIYQDIGGVRQAVIEEARDRKKRFWD